MPPWRPSWFVWAPEGRRGIAADIRGEAEKAIAAAGLVVDAGVRTELAEDLTARSIQACVPLLDQQVVPSTSGH